MPLDLKRDRFLILDGGMGTQLQAAGLELGEKPEMRCLKTPEIVQGIHENYLLAGAQLVYTNSFGLNSFKYPDEALVAKIASAAAQLARAACERVKSLVPGKEACVALDLGPTGRMLKPLGDTDFESCVAAYAAVIRAAAPYCDIVAVETMTDPYELKAAVLAAKENCALPLIATVAVDEKGRLLSGLEVEGVVALLEGLGVDALGLNCGADPRLLQDTVSRLVAVASIPVLLKLNAGLPRERDGKTVFDMEPMEFGALMRGYAAMGVQGLGGCCGTTPRHIEALVEALQGLPFQKPRFREETLICSFGQTLKVDGPVLIGERINPTGKKAMQQALKDEDYRWMLRQAVAQEEQGAQLLDINVGLPGIDEVSMMASVVRAVQGISPLPLQLDASKPEVLESGLRAVNGKAMVNSVSAKQESLDAVLPLIRKYGGLIVGLTLDEKGIPESAEGRLRLAEKIALACDAYGIPRKDLVIDPLCMTVGTDVRAARTTLEALKLIKKSLGLKTLLGVSNISFGLPNRQAINAAFLTLALDAGLDFAILNPGSAVMTDAYDSFLLLSAQDQGAKRYISRQSGREGAPVASAPTPSQPKADAAGEALSPLRHAVLKGLKEDAAFYAKEALREMEAMRVINEILIPSLSAVGDDFANGSLFLPQLMMSADASAAAFEVIKQDLQANSKGQQALGRVILATVKGDIHDIGKNIVRTLLENYGFSVLDLGKDVDHERVVSSSIKENCRLVGLSALMTTTVDSMKKTIALLRESCPGVLIMVGGAVLTQEYSRLIGADFYCKTALDAVHCAQEVFRA